LEAVRRWPSRVLVEWLVTSRLGHQHRSNPVLPLAACVPIWSWPSKPLICASGSWCAKLLGERGHGCRPCRPGPALELRCATRTAGPRYYGRRPGGLTTCWPAARISASRCLSRQRGEPLQMPSWRLATRVAYADASLRDDAPSTC